jgi:hypothetical protein
MPEEVDGTEVLLAFLLAMRLDLDSAARRLAVYAQAFKALARVGAGPDDPRRLLHDLLSGVLLLRQIAQRIEALEESGREAG